MIKPVVGRTYKLKNGAEICILEIRDDTYRSFRGWLKVRPVSNSDINVFPLMSPNKFEKLVIEDSTEESQKWVELVETHALDWVKI